MAVIDVVSEVKQRVPLDALIRDMGIGTFPALNSHTRFRGAHGTHGSGTDTSQCEVDPRTGFWVCYSCGQGGSVIDWVLSTKFSGNRAHFGDAVQWLAEYIGIGDIESPLDGPQFQVWGVLTHLASRWSHDFLTNPKHRDVLEWAQEKWGFSTDTLRDLMIGYVDTYPEDVTRETLLQAGLISTKGTLTMLKRIVFPYFKGAQVRWMTGRAPNDGTEPKYLALEATGLVQPILYNHDQAYHRLDTEGLIITEGPADAAMAYQCGLRAVAIGGTSVKRDNVEDLLAICRVAHTRYIMLDNEANDAGNRGAKRVAQLLVNNGVDPLVVTLPRDSDKIDLCDFLRHRGVDELYKMLINGVDSRGIPCHPKTLGEFEIDECPNRPEADRIMRIMETFADLPDVVANKYLKALMSKTGASQPDLKKMLAQVRKSHERRELELDEAFQEIPTLAQAYEYHPDQDVWRAHMMVYAPYITRIRRGPDEETSSVRAAIHLQVDQYRNGRFAIVAHDKYLPPYPEEFADRMPDYEVMNSVDTNEYAWSFKKDNSHSVKNFLEGPGQTVDVADMYHRIYSLFDKAVLYPNPSDKTLLTLFTMFSYLYMGFDAVPYIHCTGPQDAGKSTTMRIINALAFNAVNSDSMTPAAVFRICNNNRPTLLIDEVEDFNRAQAGSVAYDLARIARAGYQKGIKTYRCVGASGGGFETEAFTSYGPKVFGSIASLGTTLSSRCIPVQFAHVTSDKLVEYKNWIQHAPYIRKECQELRDMLHVWSITQFRLVRDIYDGYTSLHFPEFGSRNRDIYLPLFALAEVVGTALGQDLQSEMVENARAKTRLRRIQESDLDFGMVILKHLNELLSAGTLMVKVVKGRPMFPTSLAVEQIELQMRLRKEWTDGKNNLTANYLNKVLRDCGAIPVDARPMTYALPDGRKVPHWLFTHDRLIEYLNSKGAVIANGDDEVDTDTVSD